MIHRQHFRLYVPEVPGKGRGVFTDELIPAGAVVETAPVIVIAPEELDFFAESKTLSDYLFAWGDDSLALALGHGSLYNHSESPNLKVERDFEHQFITFRARRDIGRGEELAFNYVVVWFPIHP